MIRFKTIDNCFKKSKSLKQYFANWLILKIKVKFMRKFKIDDNNFQGYCVKKNYFDFHLYKIFQFF